ncbi:MAG TPA: hypothetical protein VFB45_27595 [Pseudolabrys sp.]|nr:hypothetical protein [Pseudolabrys sp.]
MFIIGFPLLLIPFAIYNIIAFLMPGVGWGDALTHLGLRSGADWAMSAGDMLVVLAVLLLFLEALKAARMRRRSLVDHGLSLLLFLGMTAEFVLVRQAATATFFILLVTSLVDVAIGLVVRGRPVEALAAMPAHHDLPVHENEPIDLKHEDEVKPVEDVKPATP